MPGRPLPGVRFAEATCSAALRKPGCGSALLSAIACWYTGMVTGSELSGFDWSYMRVTASCVLS